MKENLVRTSLSLKLLPKIKLSLQKKRISEQKINGQNEIFKTVRNEKKLTLYFEKKQK